MNTDYRALCAELIDALDGWHQAVLETGTGWVRPDETYLLDRARAALAEPDGPAVQGREPAAVVEEPSDEELLELMPEGFTAPVCAAAAIQANVLSFARAVLARFGNHSPDATKMVGPAEGEVAELVEFLRIYGDEVMDEYGDVGEHDQLTRAADLLSIAYATGPEVWEPIPLLPAQCHPTPAPPAEGEVAELVAWLRGANWDSKRQTLATRAADLLEQFSSGWVVPTVEQAQQLAPVPVADRPWEQDGWCDQQGRCWMGRPLPDAPDRWDWSSAVTNDNATHCLPHDVQTLPTCASQPPA